MISVFIDGREGATGLQIEQRLASMPDVRLLDIDPGLRKDENERKRLLNQADCVFLCLPDTAARKAVSFVENPDTVIIDASTAHRTEPGWAYGLPELSDAHEAAVKDSNRIAVPGCHASGFCALIYPLVRTGLIASREMLSCFSLTGYSGGGKAMIAEYEGPQSPRGARPYALGLTHKHLPEMVRVCGLEKYPIFVPVLTGVRQGMLVSVPLEAPANPLYDRLAGWYKNAKSISVMPFGGEGHLESGRMEMEALNGTDKLEIYVFGNEKQTLLMAKLDNLGKGASGAAVQCMKLRLGL